MVMLPTRLTDGYMNVLRAFAFELHVCPLRIHRSRETDNHGFLVSWRGGTREHNNRFAGTPKSPLCATAALLWPFASTFRL